MVQTKNALTAVEIRKSGAGRLLDGSGLMLDLGPDGRGKWTYRYSFAKNRRDMGLGSYPDVSLAEARRARDRWAALLLRGVDPISERNRLREQERAEMDRQDPTLAEVAQTVFEAKKAGLRGEGERGRWFSPIRTHILPKLGHRRISTIHQSDIKATLQPIWKTKTATAEKAIGRLGIIFRQAKLMGLQADPFTVEAARHMLGELQRNVTHIEATPWQDIPALFKRLDRTGASYQCLRLMILTAVRGDAARGARLEEFDGDIWTVPADRMKGREGKAKPFRVPLSPAAQELVKAQAEFSRDGFLFPSYRVGCITSTALTKSLGEIGEAGRPHGFRTSFRTWVQETEAASFDVAETALGHIVGGKVERSYARSDLLDKRRVLMERWGEFVVGGLRQHKEDPNTFD